MQMDPSRRERNPYLYGTSNPITFADPSGLRFIRPIPPCNGPDWWCALLQGGSTGALAEATYFSSMTPAGPAIGILIFLAAACITVIPEIVRGADVPTTRPAYSEADLEAHRQAYSQAVRQSAPEPVSTPEPEVTRIPPRVATNTPEPTRRLYHGTSSVYAESIIAGIDLRFGREMLDFGQGFYTTASWDHAESLAFRAVDRSGGVAAIVQFDVPLQPLEALPHLVFTSADASWSSFVFRNRHNRGLRHPYDWVEGPVADEWDREPVVALPYPRYHQLSIHTEAARRLFQSSITEVYYLE